jgi:polysaccharide export outer membrane protein
MGALAAQALPLVVDCSGRKLELVRCCPLYRGIEEPRDVEPMRPKLRHQRQSIVAILTFTLAIMLSVPRPKAESANDFPVGSGDLLRVAVYGDENVARFLSGDFRVDRDGTIKYPVLGSLAVAGKTPDELVQLIRISLGDKAQILVTPAVTVAEYAPVFLLGDVQKPGSTPYQPDMTVLQLILATGGLPGNKDTPGRLQTAKQELHDLELLSFSFGAERTRLLAELQSKEFDTSSLSAEATKAELDIIANEQAKYDIHRRAKETQATAYETQLQTYDAEIDSLKRSIDLHDQEIKLVKDEMAIQENLVGRGLAPRTKLSEIRRESVVIQRQALEFRTALYRAQQNRLSVEQRLAEIQINLDTQNLDRLRNVNLELERTRFKLEATRSLSAKLQTETNTTQNVFGRTPTYTILRHAGGAYHATIVGGSAKLQRGDILRVDFATDEMSGGEAPAGQ